MAYSDYGANVYLNGESMPEYEDAYIYDNDEGGGWKQACCVADASDPYHWLTSIHHGIVGDNKIRIICHKQHLPDLYVLVENRIKQINIADITGIEIPSFNWGRVEFQYKGYLFELTSGDPYEEDSPCVAGLTTPSGDIWMCEYNYFT